MCTPSETYQLTSQVVSKANEIATEYSDRNTFLAGFISRLSNAGVLKSCFTINNIIQGLDSANFQNRELGVKHYAHTEGNLNPNYSRKLRNGVT